LFRLLINVSSTQLLCRLVTALGSFKGDTQSASSSNQKLYVVIQTRNIHTNACCLSCLSSLRYCCITQYLSKHILR